VSSPLVIIGRIPQVSKTAAKIVLLSAMAYMPL